MAETGVARGGRRGVAVLGARLGFGLAIAALLLLVLAPLGWRTGLWGYRFSLLVLMRYSAYLAAAAAIVLLLSLVGWGRLGGWARLSALVGLVIAGALLYLPWHYRRLGASVPPIDDITTDPVNPPHFAAVLPARAAEDSNSVTYNPAITKLQQAAYPDIKPLTTALPPAEAFPRALSMAEHMPGWRLVVSDPAAGHIEARQSSFWFGFTDDIVIRVAADGTGSRIDMRSESRHGRGDFGVNAARVRAYLAALGPALR
jgi:uncharacterized protein (DUF1499 family)